MTSSPEPNERYTGGSKDSLFGERHGRVAFNLGGAGGDDGDKPHENSAGGSGGGEHPVISAPGIIHYAKGPWEHSTLHKFV